MGAQNAPGACTDCGNDAYIRLAGSNGESVMVCAHCFADRARAGKLPKVTPPRHLERTEPDHRFRR